MLIIVVRKVTDAHSNAWLLGNFDGDTGLTSE